MILVDSSVWMDHFRKPSRRLADFLEAEEICIHPFVSGKGGPDLREAPNAGNDFIPEEKEQVCTRLSAGVPPLCCVIPAQAGI